MTKYQVLFIALNSYFNSIGQNTSYWQQEINYDISVSLDDKKDELSGFQTIEYFNNSQDTLNELYIHLIPNALSNNSTPYVQQRIAEANRSLYFTDKSLRPFMKTNNLRVNGSPADFKSINYNEFIKVTLPFPLTPNRSLELTMDFLVSIAKMNNRFGKTKETYYCSNWYPKICAYSLSGWHLDPYLYNGELYQDFGSYNVDIKLGKDYIIAATGESSNRSSIYQKNKEINHFDFSQNNVHDFTWVASKNFHVDTVDFKMTNGENLRTELYYNKKNQSKWKNANSHLTDILTYYSEQIGQYPYKNLKIVEGKTGMEYPGLVVVDGYSGNFRLEQSMLHEIGHSWFFAAIGTNQSDHMWMDEGINTFNDFEYLADKYPDLKIFGLNTDAFENNFGEDIISLFGLKYFDFKSSREVLYKLLAAYNRDQPITSKASEFSYFNYSFIGYLKASIIVEHLSNHMGKEAFDSAMKEYYDTWKFKHPTPNDFLKIFEKHSNTSLDWFMPMLRTNEKLDPKLKRHPNGVVIQQKDTLQIPLKIGMYQDNVLVELISKPTDQDTLVIPRSSKFNKLVIDPFKTIPDINRSNNQLSFNKNKWRKDQNLKLQLVGSIDDPDSKELYILPTIAYNTSDRTMLGIAFYNSIFQTKPISYEFLPFYSFEQNALRGSFKLNYNQILSPDFGSIRFSPLYSSYAGYQKVGINNFIFFKNKETSVSQSLHFSYFKFHVDSDILPQYETKYQIGGITFNRNKSYLINETNIKVSLESNLSDFFKLTAEYTFQYQFLRNKYLNIRAFSGFIEGNDQIKDIYKFYLSGSSDYQFNEIFLDRAQKSNTILAFSRQTDLQDGAFKSYAPLAPTNWISAINFSIDIPNIPIFGVFGDISYLPNSIIEYDWGIQMRLLKEIAYVYIPLGGVSYNSKFSDSFDQIRDNIRFTLKLNKANIFYQIDKKFGLRY